LSASTLLVVIALAATACGTGGSVAASIGETEITVAEVEAEYARRAEAPSVASELAKSDDEVDPALQASVLTTLIRAEVLHQAAEERGIEVTDEERSEQRAVIVEQLGGQEQLDEVLAQANVSAEELEDDLTDQAIQVEISKELASEVSDEDVEQAFEEDPQGQYGEKVEVRHVLTETKKDADTALERIESGEDFAKVAKDLSKDPGSAENGGELGEIAQGSTVEAFDEAAFEAEVGELVGPIETEFGFHVLEVTKQVPGAELEDVSDDIRTQLETASQGQAFGAFITEFIAGLEVEVDPRYGTWDAQSVSVLPPAGPSEAPVPPGAGSELPGAGSELPGAGSELPGLSSEPPVEPVPLPSGLPSQ
jgi:parvulin-like peptidyl-prolyl isomerase